MPFTCISCVKYGMTMSKDKEAVVRTQSHVKNPINLTLRSKVNVVSGFLMYSTFPHTVIDICSKHGKQMSKQTEVIGRI